MKALVVKAKAFLNYLRKIQYFLKLLCSFPPNIAAFQVPHIVKATQVVSQDFLKNDTDLENAALESFSILEITA